MNETRSQPLLDTEFWSVTVLLTVISALLMWGVVIFPIDAWLPEASTVSKDIDFIYRFMAFFSVPILVYVNGYIVYFMWRYHVAKGEDRTATGSDIHDHPGLEAAWTIVPSILMLILGVLSYVVLPKYYLASAASVATIEGIGHTFFFEFRYPGLAQPVDNDLHLPVGKQVTIDLTSSEPDIRNAVIHSFWVPEFRVKQDMIPGMIVPIHITPARIGTFRIICTEFCGVGHSDMVGKVVVESQSDFDNWFKSEQHMQSNGATQAPISIAGGDAAAGGQKFAAKCTTCHGTGAFAERKVGPGLGNLFHDPDHPTLVTGKPANADDVADIIEHGFSGDLGTMPNMQVNQLTPKDVANLVAYLESLHK
ncbi:MAG: cytochrome c oxidase subunit II [Candidatus Eremiobacteraeota bacterium]|nr:cytochrome c oxidase subunit II [Candidatus Eremiobacteraeota bacterium]